jgi:acyl-coenzyme A thioesterase PaaI-like protein
MEGYVGHLHGGLIAALLDGAMTNCLFSHGIRAVTGELVVRMIHPLRPDTTTMVRGWLERRLSPLYLLQAELRQDGHIAAKGRAKFMQTIPSARNAIGDTHDREQR